MKILYCTNQLHTHGGIERILSQKINFLIKEYGFEVFLLTSDQKNKKFIYDLDKKIIFDDLQINYIENVSYFHPKNLFKILKHYLKLKKQIKKINPDVIISVSFTPDQYFIPFINTKIPKIKELHSSGIVVANLENGKNWISSYCKKFLFNQFKKYMKLVVLNKDELQYYDKKNTIVIPNFTDFEVKTEVVREKTIIAAGRIAEVKQFEELLYIWQKIHKECPGWKVKIFGDGTNSFVQNLKDKVLNLGLENSFFIYPATSNILVEMQKATLFAMTSKTECFPMVLLEAQICGLPIISYDCPNGPRNIINNNIDGYLIENYNRQVFAERLKNLINSKILLDKMSLNAVTCAKNSSKSIVMDSWLQLFKTVSLNE